ncbi:hypothetical protein MPH_11942 [Macrophomina phaseolina MS6]|uniref:Uncharacterized protein n=1 Tax=Macrophomina phaseolina (strain MS6) TaxID=1126212 RepID=K2RLA7_MACPH|nr:hypothetical protein MPH_11942 [Macrophomina phaseolina MS6]
MTLPSEVRQQILGHVCDEFRPRNGGGSVEGALKYLRQLYDINRTIRAEMSHVESAWRRKVPMNIATFAAYAKNPVAINGVLTLALFDHEFLNNPPSGWEVVVQQLHQMEEATQKIEQTKDMPYEWFMSLWFGLVKELPLKGANRLGIRRVQVVETSGPRAIREPILARMKILLMVFLGLRSRCISCEGIREDHWTGPRKARHATG